MRLAEAQAATKEGNRESTVQMASGLRARCLELEELVARLTRDIRSAQEEMSSQVPVELRESGLYTWLVRICCSGRRKPTSVNR